MVYQSGKFDVVDASHRPKRSALVSAVAGSCLGSVKARAIASAEPVRYEVGSKIV
jgi:hypothetical protein